MYLTEECYLHDSVKGEGAEEEPLDEKPYGTFFIGNFTLNNFLWNNFFKKMKFPEKNVKNWIFGDNQTGPQNFNRPTGCNRKHTQ